MLRSEIATAEHVPDTLPAIRHVPAMPGDDGADAARSA